jgi:hypothetical protein
VQLATVTFDSWMQTLRALAAERGLQWLMDDSGGTHRDGFDRGLSPDEELTALADMAEWRGCGCGGS